MYNKTFRGGVHPDDGKSFARDIPFQTWLPKGDMVFHLNQHIGKPAKPVVQKGDQVLAGQLIAEADGFVSANIVSSCSGKVKAIEKRKNVLGTSDMSIVNENDGQYTLAEGIGTEVDYTCLLYTSRCVEETDADCGDPELQCFCWYPAGTVYDWSSSL